MNTFEAQPVKEEGVPLLPLQAENEQGAKSEDWKARLQAEWSTFRIDHRALLEASAAARKPEPAEYRPFVWSQRPPLNHWASMRLDAERPYPPPAAAASSAAAAASTPKPVVGNPPAAAQRHISRLDFRKEEDHAVFMAGSTAAYCQPFDNLAYWLGLRDRNAAAARSPPVVAPAGAAAPARPLEDKPRAERKPRAPRKRKAEEELVAPPSSGVDVDTSDPKDIGSSLQCGVCLGLLYRPLVMKCKHSVCYVCYLELVKHKGRDKVVCPMRCKPGRDRPSESLVLNDAIQTFLQHSGRFTPVQLAARKLEEAHWDKVITRGSKKQRAAP